MNRLGNYQEVVRFSVAEDRIGLEWKEAGAVHRTPARLASLSDGGALLLAEQRPPLHQVVRVRVRGEWVQGFVARHHTPDLVELVLRGNYR